MAEGPVLALHGDGVGSTRGRRELGGALGDPRRKRRDEGRRWASIIVPLFRGVPAGVTPEKMMSVGIVNCVGVAGADPPLAEGDRVACAVGDVADAERCAALIWNRPLGGPPVCVPSYSMPDPRRGEIAVARGDVAAEQARDPEQGQRGRGLRRAEERPQPRDGDRRVRCAAVSVGVEARVARSSRRCTIC